jgi:hypothetical protein
MMDDIRHHCHVIQSICDKRTVAHTIQFLWTSTHEDQAMNSSRFISYTPAHIQNIHALIFSLSLLLAYGRKKDYFFLPQRYPVRIILIYIISSTHNRFYIHQDAYIIINSLRCGFNHSLAHFTNIW